MHACIHSHAYLYININYLIKKYVFELSECIRIYDDSIAVTVFFNI